MSLGSLGVRAGIRDEGSEYYREYRVWVSDGWFKLEKISKSDGGHDGLVARPADTAKFCQYRMAGTPFTTYCEFEINGRSYEGTMTVRDGDWELAPAGGTNRFFIMFPDGMELAVNMLRCEPE